MKRHGQAWRIAIITLTLGFSLGWLGCGGGGSAATPAPANNPVPSIANLSPSSATAGAAVQTLTINGTNFLSSSTVAYNGAGHTATFVSATQLTISLSAADQATAGTYAVVVTNPAPGGGASNSMNFTVNNPAPTITSLSPSSATAETAAQTLTINGTNFLSSSTVTYNGAGHTATFLSAAQLTISLSTSDQATAGTYAVVVMNPSPGGGASNSVNFTVNNPAPAITSLSPSSATAGAAAQTLTINGTNFLSSSTVTYNGTGHTATFVSAAQLTISLSASDQATGGNYQVVVTNPAPDGGASNSRDFTVDNLVPTIAGTSPVVLAVGSPDTSISVSGSNFVSTSKVTLGGGALNTTYVSSTQLNATIPASDLSQVSSLQIGVDNPSPGGGNSGTASIALVSIKSFVILAIPQTAGQPNGPWSVAAAATDQAGNPVVGLPISLNAQYGTLGSTSAVSDSLGTFVATYTPSPSNSTEVDTLSATTGGQTAVAVVSTDTPSGSANAVATHSRQLSSISARKSVSSLTAQMFYNSTASLGISAAPGSTNEFVSLSTSQQQCVTSVSGSATLSNTCLQTLSDGGVSLSQANVLSESCQVANLVSEVEGIAECAGAVAIPIGCFAAADATFGTAAMVCVLSFSDVEEALGSGCIGFLAADAAQMTLGAQGGVAADVAEFLIQPAADSLSGAVQAVACELVSPPPPPPTSAPICTPGKTCLFVTNYSNNTVTAYDEQGNLLNEAAAAFPNLNKPHGITYDGRTGYLYVVANGPATINAYDLAGNEVPTSATFTFPQNAPNAQEIKYDSFSDTLYASDPTDNTILAYSPQGGQISLTSAFANLSNDWGLFWDPTNGNIYVSSVGTGTISAFTATGMPVTLGVQPSGITDPGDIAIDPGTGDIFVTETAQNATLNGCVVSGILKFDGNGNNITPSGSFSTVDCPNGLGLDRNNNQIYVVNLYGGTGNGSVTVYDFDGNDITSAAAPGGFPSISEPAGIVVVSNPPAASSSQVTTTISIPAGQSLTDTGLAISAGETVTITASGTIYVGALSSSALDYETPNGQPWPACAEGSSLPYFSPGLPCWSLIGAITQTGTPFEVGSSTTFEAASAGELYLGVNDSYYPDNSGAWTVTITVPAGSSPSTSINGTQKHQ